MNVGDIGILQHLVNKDYNRSVEHYNGTTAEIVSKHYIGDIFYVPFNCCTYETRADLYGVRACDGSDAIISTAHIRPLEDPDQDVMQRDEHDLLVTSEQAVMDGDVISTVPEPTSLVLMSLGLIGLAFSRHKRFH